MKPESKVRVDVVEDGVWLANHECFRASFLTGLLEELERLGVELRSLGEVVRLLQLHSRDSAQG